MEPRGQALIARYKAVYSIPDEAAITEQMILAHWDLERQLTQDLLSSTAQDRWETFDRSYTRLYSELEWLNRFAGESATSAASNHAQHRKWHAAIGAPPLAVYEIGSGKGELVTYLARHGFSCRATEITRERGEKHSDADTPNLSWGVSDGVHIDDFEAAAGYDVAISDQVLEHLHPEDLEAHLRGALRILKPGGRYIFRTPHRFSGPHDVSQVFNCDKPLGMHLKEYTHREILTALRSAGFTRAYYPFIPTRHTRVNKRVGQAYLQILLVVEHVLSWIPDHRIRRVGARLLGKLRLFGHNVSLTAEKP
ncbi:class I SAM-dependent methyltransferase [Mycobacterium kyorinense]|uniref:SAM-dependent methyltransferase n=1 Tax=Mycobacterium kyorinense TaxID=487514 RepID=A0A1X1XVS1_9MYCO|nr:class I SAM-dependent methyltransferase [Mycobacterium kyorinense]ORW02958.1 SAM-dependent methyltransferase [Mycobacterium kyorinense]